MADQELATLEARGLAAEVDGHTRDFWANELEVPYDQVLERAIQPGFMEAWLEKKNGRQVDVLRRTLGIDGAASGRLKEMKKQLRSDDDELLPYVLVQEFVKFKSKLATIGHAKKALPPAILDLCRKGDGDDDYDTLALCLAIYHHDAQQLRSILHLDRIHKTGFARMRMKDGPRRPKERLADFLSARLVEDVLGRFDKSKADGRTSEFKNIMVDGDNHLVFIRRCERPSLIMQGHDILHGYRPEWIVLVFFDGAKRVNISSLSVEDSLEIANRIASEYYGTPCEYENDSAITYAKQLERLFERLKNDDDEKLTLVELVANNSPLDNSCALRFSHSGASSIGPSLKHFETKIGNVLAAIDAIESIKVLYAKKRVSLILEKHGGIDDQFVVRYSDHRLNPLERVSFETYMAETHAIQVLSTEKRFKHVS